MYVKEGGDESASGKVQTPPFRNSCFRAAANTGEDAVFNDDYGILNRLLCGNQSVGCKYGLHL